MSQVTKGERCRISNVYKQTLYTPKAFTRKKDCRQRNNGGEGESEDLFLGLEGTYTA